MGGNFGHVGSRNRVDDKTFLNGVNFESLGFPIVFQRSYGENLSHGKAGDLIGDEIFGLEGGFRWENLDDGRALVFARSDRFLAEAGIAERKSEGEKQDG